eukprot:8294497-Prorocentrum_lima.AAC.1
MIDTDMSEEMTTYTSETVLTQAATSILAQANERPSQERDAMTKETIKTFQYRITQATASQLVVILYDMAIEYLNDACESDSAKQAHNNIYMAQKVIDQLICGLDMQYEISANLF